MCFISCNLQNAPSLTRALLVGDGLALHWNAVLEDVHSVLDRLPVQANLQRVDAGGDILGQQVARFCLQALGEGSNLILAESWDRRSTGWDWSQRIRVRDDGGLA